MAGHPETTPQISGNTNAGDFSDLVKKHDFKQKRDFFITLNYEKDEDIEKAKLTLLNKLNNIIKYLMSLKYRYILTCLEKNTKGFYHIHIFIQFNTPHKLNIAKMEGANIQIRRGSVNECINYLRKDCVILHEYGNPAYLLGNPSIKDIAMSRFSDIDEQTNGKYYRVYKEIKHDRQGLINCNKTIYIIDNIDNLDLNKFKNYNLLDMKQGKIKYWPINMIVPNNLVNENNINALLRKMNKPIQSKFFANDVENIIFELDINKTNQNQLFEKIKEYNNHKIIFLYNTGELDSDEFEEETIINYGASKKQIRCKSISINQIQEDTEYEDENDYD